MNDINIRLAAKDDREALCRLYHDFHEFHVHGVPDRLVSLGKMKDTYKDSDLYNTVGKIIDDTEAAIFLAETDNKVVGFVEIYIREDEANPCRKSYKYGYMQSLMVDGEFRTNDVGTRLTEAAHRWAKEKNAEEMRLDIWEFPEGPLGFYEKIGYGTLRRTLVRKLG